MSVIALFEGMEAAEPVCPGGLPIFRWMMADYAVFYAPGYVCVVDPTAARAFEATIVPEDHGAGGTLWRHAKAAVDQDRRWQTGDFVPESLTLYMNNACNLGCTYCHTDPSQRSAERLDLDVIAAAAPLVAESCRHKGRPFFGVFHGGGEPVLERERIDRALSILEAVAAEYDVDLLRYVATNGVMPAEKARWLARRFDLVGLSCDGPPDVQNAQRPRLDGGKTARIVERTGRILAEAGCRFHVRTTITSATLHRQAEIADYVCRTFAPDEIRFEPVYLGGRATAPAGPTVDQSQIFVAHFLEARALARRRGVLLTFSGTRPDALHGPYCHVFRHTLNLVPGGVATACFKLTEAAQVARKDVAIGAMDQKEACFVIDRDHVQALIRVLNQEPSRCTICFNRYHCARDCPDRGPLERTLAGETAGFRCLAQKAIAFATIRETATHLWAERADIERVYGTRILRSVLPIGTRGC
jgi:uncharacterized protein